MQPVRLEATAIALALSLAAQVVHADVVAVVSARSSVTSLSRIQVADIFLGRSARLPDGRTVVPVDQAEGTSARDEFYARFTGKSPAQIKAYWSKIIFTGRGLPPRTVRNDVEVKKLLAGNPDAIGYIERLEIDANVRAVQAQ
ncbi:MAG: phosphate ABC transporter substrate-binding protein [Steroidobacteraceae bacterium]